MSVKELTRKAMSIPTMMSVAMLLTRRPMAAIIRSVIVEPMNAAEVTPIDDIWFDDDKKSPVEPDMRIIKATPRLAPEDIPSIDGSARGFLKSVCIMSPAVASAAPARSAVTDWGSRYSNNIVAIVLLSSGFCRALMICVRFISTVPSRIFKKNRATESSPNKHKSSMFFLVPTYPI